MNIKNLDHRDQLERLNQVLNDPRLHDPGGPEPGVAYRLAVTFGTCQLLGVPVPAEMNDTLPALVAGPAADTLTQELRRLQRRIETLADDWADAAHPEEGDELVFELVESRTDAEAALVALEESIPAIIEREGTHTEQLIAAMDTIAELLADLDSAFANESQILSTAAHSRLVESWLDSVADAHRDRPLWNFYAHLAEVAQATLAHAIESLPSEAFAQVVQEIERKHRRGPILPVPVWSGIAAGTNEIPAGVAAEHRWVWRSPDGRMIAEMWVPTSQTAAEDEQERPLNFDLVDGFASAVELIGQEVRLGSVIATVSEPARVILRLRELRDGSPLRLTVSGQTWDFVEEGD